MPNTTEKVNNQQPEDKLELNKIEEHLRQSKEFETLIKQWVLAEFKKTSFRKWFNLKLGNLEKAMSERRAFIDNFVTLKNEFDSFIDYVDPIRERGQTAFLLEDKDRKSNTRGKFKAKLARLLRLVKALRKGDIPLHLQASAKDLQERLEDLISWFDKHAKLHHEVLDEVETLGRNLEEHLGKWDNSIPEINDLRAKLGMVQINGRTESLLRLSGKDREEVIVKYFKPLFKRSESSEFNRVFYPKAFANREKGKNKVELLRADRKEVRELQENLNLLLEKANSDIKLANERIANLTAENADLSQERKFLEQRLQNDQPGLLTRGASHIISSPRYDAWQADKQNTEERISIINHEINKNNSEIRALKENFEEYKKQRVILGEELRVLAQDLAIPTSVYDEIYQNYPRNDPNLGLEVFRLTGEEKREILVRLNEDIKNKEAEMIFTNAQVFQETMKLVSLENERDTKSKILAEDAEKAAATIIKDQEFIKGLEAEAEQVDSNPAFQLFISQSIQDPSERERLVKENLQMIIEGLESIYERATEAPALLAEAQELVNNFDALKQEITALDEEIEVSRAKVNSLMCQLEEARESKDGLQAAYMSIDQSPSIQDHQAQDEEEEKESTDRIKEIFWGSKDAVIPVTADYLKNSWDEINRKIQERHNVLSRWYVGLDLAKQELEKAKEELHDLRFGRDALAGDTPDVRIKVGDESLSLEEINARMESAEKDYTNKRGNLMAFSKTLAYLLETDQQKKLWNRRDQLKAEIEKFCGGDLVKEQEIVGHWALDEEKFNEQMVSAMVKNSLIALELNHPLPEPKLESIEHINCVNVPIHERLNELKVDTLDTLAPPADTLEDVPVNPASTNSASDNWSGLIVGGIIAAALLSLIFGAAFLSTNRKNLPPKPSK